MAKAEGTDTLQHDGANKGDLLVGFKSTNKNLVLLALEDITKGLSGGRISTAVKLVAAGKGTDAELWRAAEGLTYAKPSELHDLAIKNSADSRNVLHFLNRNNLRVRAFTPHEKCALDVVRKILDSFSYKTDNRNLPDARRKGQFRAGWNNAIHASQTYQSDILSTLTWNNLGNRFGNYFGIDVQDEVKNAVFDCCAMLYNEGKQTRKLIELSKQRLNRIRITADANLFALTDRIEHYRKNPTPLTVNAALQSELTRLNQDSSSDIHDYYSLMLESQEQVPYDEIDSFFTIVKKANWVDKPDPFSRWIEYFAAAMVTVENA